MSEGDDAVLHRRRVRHANPVSMDSIFEATASQYAVNEDEYEGFRSGAAGRELARNGRFLARLFDEELLYHLQGRTDQEAHSTFLHL